MPELVEVKSDPDVAGLCEIWVGGFCVLDAEREDRADAIDGNLRKAIRSILRAEQEACCKAVCPWCARGGQAAKTWEGWRHESKRRLRPKCQAAPIRERILQDAIKEAADDA